MEGWLRDNLVCPRDYSKLTQLGDDTLVCTMGHRYPIIDDIPIMLLEEKVPTQEEIFRDTFSRVKDYKRSQHSNFYHNVSGSNSCPIDLCVQKVIFATCGIMYKPSINRLTKYPIPKLPLYDGHGKCFLELGCNWGRWCISAAQLGYIPVGIDHNLDAVRAAYRVARQLGVSAHYLVADVRYLPFPGGIFDIVFSYSVLQHFSKDDVRICLGEVWRILKESGKSLVQMPSKFGLRNLYHQLKRNFREPMGFEVRYWNPSELIVNFNRLVGPTSLFVDGFFSLNAQSACRDILPLRYRVVVNCSEILHWISDKVQWLKYCADSLYVESLKVKL